MMSIKNTKQKQNDFANTAIASGEQELIQRFGRAGQEYLIGLRGINNETGQIFDRSLQKISEGKLNPDYIERNIKQQAGFSAEIKSVSHRNAEAIIEGRNSQTFRSEDVPGFGKNHKVVDIVEIDGGKVITSQTKFVTDGKVLLKKIACGEGGGKDDMSRYLGVDKLEVPTEQVEKMKEICHERADSLIKQSERLRREGKLELAEKKAHQAKNYKKLEGKISDSGLTTDDAIKARLNPKWETAKDIGRVSHRAGVEGAKTGMAIGGTISIVSNIIAVSSGDKEFSEALLDTSKDTAISGAVGYATGASGSAIKTLMGQSAKETTRNLAKTGLPAMVVSATLAVGKSIKKYAGGEIDEGELMQEAGLTVSGMLSASMFAAIGQLAIPMPVLGGLIGGMVGYTLTNSFYQSFFDALQEKNLSAERRAGIEMQCAAAKLVAREYEQKITALFDSRVKELEAVSQSMFQALDDSNLSPDEFCLEMNRFAKALGVELSIKNMAELDEAMQSDKPLII